MNERCFAHRRNGKCVALTGEQCAGYAVCSFYKPIWKHAQDVARADQRLNRLSIQEQRDIAEKYHNGEMPWKGENECRQRNIFHRFFTSISGSTANWNR